MAYTTSQLNSKNKGQLVDLVEQLQAEVSAAKAEPLSASAYRQRLLVAQADIEKIRQAGAAKKEEIALEREQLDKEYAFKTKELELKYDSEKSMDLEAIEIRLDELAKDVEASINESESAIELSEAELKTREEAVVASEKDHADRLDALKTDWADKTASFKAKFEEEKSSVIKSHERTMEELKYNHAQEIKRENEESFAKFAKTLKMAVIGAEELLELKEQKSRTAEEQEKAISDAVKKEKAIVENRMKRDAEKMESKLKNELALANKDIEHLTSSNVEYKVQIEALQAELKKVPSQIKEAVAAAKSELVVNQDAGKK